MTKDTVSAYRARARATEQLVDDSVATVKAEQAARFERARLDAAARTAPMPFSETQYLGARAVRTRLGWHEVVRVNAKSVTVKTGHSWDDRIARPKILEVR